MWLLMLPLPAWVLLPAWVPLPLSRRYKQTLREHNVRIFVRRGGPNYQEGLRRMRDAGAELQIPIYVR